MTPNEQITHDLLTRQIDLMRYERSVRRDVLQQLEAMRREVGDKLRGQNLNEMGRRELAALLADIEAILRRDYDLISGSLNTAEVVEDESEWLLVWLGGMAAMYGLPEPKRLPETHKQALQNGLLVGGLTVAEAFAGQRDALMRRIRAQVRMAAVGGSGWESLKTDLQAAFKRAIRHAETTTATWISTIANQTTYWAGKANSWVKGYRHISVLDSKTSSVCANRHGKLWDKQKQPQGHDFAFRVPPMHPNCRSRLVWVADLGDDFQGVSGEDWVKGRTLAQLQEQFGKGIGQMLHDGTISLHDAVRRGGLVPVTLSELQAQYGMGKHIVRTAWHHNFPDTVIDRKLGEATGHAFYAAAKSGDASAAYLLASELVTDDAVRKLREAVGSKEVMLAPVLAEEAVGRNKIPLAVAAVLSAKTGWQLHTHIIQATKVSRTGGDGWYRLANAPEFSGDVVKGRYYVLVDDTQTQGGTFAAMKGYIERKGGRVVGAYALTGKQYSVQLRLSESTLRDLRAKYAEIEPWYVETFGHDFSHLTEWEAKFIINSRKSPDAVRDSIIAARNE